MADKKKVFLLGFRPKSENEIRSNSYSFDKVVRRESMGHVLMNFYLRSFSFSGSISTNEEAGSHFLPLSSVGVFEARVRRKTAN